MTAGSYLLLITRTTTSANFSRSVINIAGRGQALGGRSRSDDNICKELWMIFKGKRDKHEMITQLKAVPGVNDVTAAAVSLPVEQHALKEVRALFASFGWDANGIDDETLTLFIEARLKGEYRYYIDYDHLHHNAEPTPILIKLLTAHPLFHPDWLKEPTPMSETSTDEELTDEDIVIEYVNITEEEYIEDPPPPPIDGKKDMEE